MQSRFRSLQSETSKTSKTSGGSRLVKQRSTISLVALFLWRSLLQDEITAVSTATNTVLWCSGYRCNHHGSLHLSPKKSGLRPNSPHVHFH